MTIYYATQTGTAESFAEQLKREGPDHGFYIHTVDMEETELEELMKHPPFENDDDESGIARAIVLVATYGEGEPTDNSTALVQACKQRMEEGKEEEKTEALPLQGLEFCVFGLGNRQYEHYNAMGKFFDEAFEKLGGTRILPIGMGDDDADLEGDFESWKDRLWARLKEQYCKDSVLPAKRGTNESKLPQCEYAIEYHDANTKPKEITMDHVHGSSRPYFTSIDCPVATVRELRSPEDGGSTKHVEIDISKAKDLTYATADNLGVLPLNDETVVQSVAESLGYDLTAVFSLKAAPNQEWHGAPFPMPLSVTECLTRYLDLTSAPRRSDLKMLVQYATDPVDRKALLRLSSKEGKQEYKEKITGGYVGMVDLLKLCPSLSIPLEHFVSICHFLLPRYYTIASSSSVHPEQVHLTVAVTQEKRKDKSLFNGVCSTHLANLNPTKPERVRIFNRPSTFRLPKDSSRPILMIGPGTGIAPMRGLLQERRYQKLSEKKTVGSNILYFGCKKTSLDYLYQDELKAFEDDGVLDKLYVAFSREQREKVYVQHLLSKNAKETWELIDSESASIYVCGGVKMGHDVTLALKEILSTQGEMSLDDAKDYLAKLASVGRFVQELWA
jgi:NADPH-ferrihemoprotein reductase